MSDDLRNDPEYYNLLRLVREGSCVAFIGSGLSASKSLYPSWGEVIGRLCAACDLPAPSLDELEDPDALFELADAACNRNEEAYCRVLKDAFARPVVETRRAYDLLMRLKFKSYITTNFDPLLAIESQKPEHRCSGVYRFPALPVQQIRTRAVYYIHGRIEVGVMPKPDQVVLGKRSFDQAYSDGGGTLNSFLHQVLTFEPLFFIGCSLREPPLRGVFETCRKVRMKIQREYTGHAAPSRYALLPNRLIQDKDAQSLRRDLDGEREESSRFGELDIKVVRYDPKDEKHSRIEEILDEWCALAPIDDRSGFEKGGLV